MQQRRPPQRKRTLPQHRDTAARLPGSESQGASSDGKAWGMSLGHNAGGVRGGRGSIWQLLAYLPWTSLDLRPSHSLWKSVPHVYLVTCEVGSVRAHHCGGTCNKGRWETTLSLSKEQLSQLWNACMREYYAATQKEHKRSHALMSKTSGSVIHGISRCRTRG